MSWKVRFIKLDHTVIYSIYRFATRAEAMIYLDWIYRNEPRRPDTAIEETDEPVNVELDKNMIWKWRIK